MFQNRATLKEIRFHLMTELRQRYTENESESISHLLLEHCGYTRTDSLLDPDLIPDPSVPAKISGMLADIHKGLPVQYILGYTYFCDLKIAVDRRVLIPRPETEEMVEHIREESSRTFDRIVDLGTGSGCIALALKHYFPGAEVWGLDISKGAISVAAENGKKNKLQVHWAALDLFNLNSMMLPGKFSLVVSNPPYVVKSEAKEMARHVLDFEPGTALFVEDQDPLIFYRALLSFCSMFLAKEGEVWVEINEQFGKKTAGLFKNRGFGKVRIIRDIHEKERYVHAIR